jgi:hypothetical protein
MSWNQQKRWFLSAKKFGVITALLVNFEANAQKNVKNVDFLIWQADLQPKCNDDFACQSFSSFFHADAWSIIKESTIASPVQLGTRYNTSMSEANGGLSYLPILHSVHRVPGFLSSRTNWLPQPPLPQASVAPPWFQGGGGTLLRERGRGEPIRTKQRWA